MTWINYYLESQVSLLNIACQLGTIWGLIYELPNFVQHMRAEKASANAQKALELLSDIKISIDRLRDGFYGEDSLKTEAMHELIALYVKLHSHLKLLPKDQTIEKHMKTVKKKLDILTVKEESQLQGSMVAYFEHELGTNFRDIIKQPKFIPLHTKHIEDDLQIIFETPISPVESFFKRLAILGGLTILI